MRRLDAALLQRFDIKTKLEKAASSRRTPNMRFTKFQGFGNDYLVFEADQLAGVGDLGGFASRICNRHYGAGGDGIAITARSADKDSDFSIRIFNPDGSEADMSGNGTRCAASYLFYHDLWSNEVLRLQTRNGLKRYHLLERSDSGSFLFRSELGQPRFDSASIPFRSGQPLDQCPEELAHRKRPDRKQGQNGISISQLGHHDRQPD